MRIKLDIKYGLWIYYVLLLIIYHYKIKHYYYWTRVANVVGGEFDFSLIRLVVSTVIFILNVKALTSVNSKKLSFMILCLFFIFLTVPSLVSLTSGSIYPYKLLLYHQLLFFTIFGFCKLKINFHKIPRLNKNQSLYLFIFIVTLGVIPYLVYYGPYLNFKNLLLLEIYETRARMSSISNSYIGYTYSVYTKIIIPLIIVFSLELKNKITLIYGILLLVLFYLFGAHKTVYFGLIVVLAFYKLSYYLAIKKAVLIFNIIIVVSILFVIFFNYDYLWILTVRRIQFIPTLLDIAYLDFFKDKPLLWSGSVFQSILPYPYSVGHTHLIGEAYFFKVEMGANNGVISDGYMNLNSLGVLINIIITSIYFSILNCLNIPSRYFGLFLLIIFSFISSSLTTALLTHGGVFLLMVSIFILQTRPNEKLN